MKIDVTYMIFLFNLIISERDILKDSKLSFRGVMRSFCRCAT